MFLPPSRTRPILEVKQPISCTYKSLEPKGGFFSVGEALRRRRLQLDKTQTEIARALGIARSTLQRVENGDRTPSWSLARDISQALDLVPILVPREKLPVVDAVLAHKMWTSPRR
jgi:DNA-binding XRE family transcriptional regulator